MKPEKLPLLTAYCDKTLSVEAARQLVRMSEDPAQPVHSGKDLPEADQKSLLKKAAVPQKSQ